MKKIIVFSLTFVILLFSLIVPCGAVEQIDYTPFEAPFITGDRSDYLNPNGWYSLYLDRIPSDDSFTNPHILNTPHYMGLYWNDIYIILRCNSTVLSHAVYETSTLSIYVNEVAFIDLPVNSPEYNEIYEYLSATTLEIYYNNDSSISRVIDFYFPLSFYVYSDSPGADIFYWNSLNYFAFVYNDNNTPLFFIPGYYLIVPPENISSYPFSITMPFTSASVGSTPIFNIYFTHDANNFTVAFNGSNNIVYSDFSWVDFKSQIVKVDSFMVGDTYGNDFFKYYPCADSFFDGLSLGDIYGYNDGYTDGYDRGLEQSITSNFFVGIFDALDSLTIFNTISVLDILKTLLGLFAFGFVLKLIAGG